MSEHEQHQQQAEQQAEREYGPRGGPKGRRPPFAKGNTLAVKSGHHSARVYGPLAEQIAAGLMETRPDLRGYPEAVAAWATLEAQTALVRRHIAHVGMIDPAAEQVRSRPLDDLLKLERATAKMRATLGLDPRSEAELARERAAASALAVDLSSLAERGRAALEAQEAAGIEDPVDPVESVLEQVQSAGEAANQRAREQFDAEGDGWVERRTRRRRDREATAAREAAAAGAADRADRDDDQDDNEQEAGS